MKSYKIRLSGNKLRVVSLESCVSVDLDMFAVLKIEREGQKVCFLDGDKAFATAEFSNVVDAANAYKTICSQVMKKNRKFRSSVFVAKLIGGVLLLAALINIMSVYNERQIRNKLALAQTQKNVVQESNLNKQEVYNMDSLNVESDLNSAAGQAVSVSDIFSVE